jgi:hypothetical protein
MVARAEEQTWDLFVHRLFFQPLSRIGYPSFSNIFL